MAIDNANAETRYAVINASTREYNLGFILREKSGVVVTRIRNGVSIVINPDDCTIENGKITLSNRVDIMAGDILVLSRVTPDTQEVILTEGSELPAKTIEYGLDRAAMRCAELDTKIENVRKYSLPTATVTQTATGATITVTNASGTTTANIANGKDGKDGDMGAPGPQGPQGPQGLKGDKGDKGDAGPQGLQGAKGDTGAKGDPGPQGVQGAKGDKGDKGDPGDDGFSPTATVTQTATGATITVTDKNGTTTANVTNGKDGSYTLPAATAETLGGVKIGANLSIAPDGTLSANATGGTPSAPSNAVEHLSTLPESWTMDDNGRVFVWEAASTEALSKGHIYKVNTTETASGILIQLTPAAGMPEDFVAFANQVSGLYTPYDTVEGSSGGTVRVYTRYKNPNGSWLRPYISGGNYLSMWMISGTPSGDPGTATDFTGTISELKTSLTAADLTSVEWGKNFMNSMQSKSFTDVAGGVSADFEDLTPASTVDIPVASTSTLGGIKVGSRLSIDANGVLSADEQSSSYTLPVASTSTLGGVKVNNSTGALKVASDGLLALLVSSPEAMKNGETGIAVNLKTNGGLMFQTVTYGNPTKALGMSPKATYNQLSGSSVTITPSVQPYKLTASGATTLNSSYSFGINDGVVSTGDIAYAEIVIVLGESGSITAGMDLTLVDALVAGKTNYCAVRWEGEKAKLFVWRVE